MTDREEKKRERKAFAISVGIHGLLVVLFLFLLAWREPNPPIPEYGIELNFGLDAAGSGDIQRTTPVNDSENKELESNETETIEKEQVESISEMEQVVDKVYKVIEVEEVADPVPVIESPDVIEVKEEKKVVKPIEKPIEKPVVKETAPAKKDPTPVTENKIEKVEGKEKQKADVVDGSQGDNTNIKGDKGDPKGSLDARALYGTPGGGGGGASLELSGWNWDYLPKPKDESQESGRIVLQITVDAEGYVIGIKTLESTVSPSIEKIYRDEVSQLTFSPTRENSKPAPSSTGRITFIIRNN